MIGEYVRGFRHLCNSASNTTPRKVLIFGNGNQHIGEVLKSENYDNKLLFFQNRHGNRDLPSNLTRNESAICKNLFEKYFYVLIIDCQQLINSLGGVVVMLPEDFDNKYDCFLKQNRKVLEKTFEKVCSPNDFLSLYVYSLTDASPNMFIWAMNNIHRYGVLTSQIRNCANWCNAYPQLIKGLSKGTPTAYNGKYEIVDLYNEMVSLRRKKRANDVINMFNTNQKKLLKSIELNDNIINILSKFNIISRAKQHNFIRKMSTIDDANEIIKQMSLLTKEHFMWSKESLYDFIRNVDGINCSIVYDKDDIVVLKVSDYDTIKYLAKTTNWCISKNKKYWNDYVGRRDGFQQYIVFDFSCDEDDDLSIIGFTSSNRNGITNAHTFSNENMMNGYSNKHSIRQFIPFKPNIFYFLKDKNIPSEIFMKINKQKFEWDRDSFVEFVDNVLGDDYDIVCDDDNKMAIITNNRLVKLILGDSFSNVNMPSINKFIIFADFSKGNTDENRLLFAGVYWDGRVKEEKATDIFSLNKNIVTNISFDSLLTEYNLPYNIICRVDDKISLFINAFRTYNINVVNSMLQDKEFVNELVRKKNLICEYNLIGIINNSLFNICSVDMLKVLYDNGIKLSDIARNDDIDTTITSLFYEICSRNRFDELPTDEDYEKLFSDNKFNIEKCKFIGFYLALSMICENESNNNNIVGCRVVECINDICESTNICTNLTNKIIGFVIGKPSLVEVLIRPIIRTNNNQALSLILNKHSKNKRILDCICRALPSDHELYNTVCDMQNNKKVKVCKT